MTRGTAGQSQNVIFIYEPATERNLVGRRSVIHIEHLVARAQISLRMPVAVQTPLHRQWLRAPRQRHFIYAAVTYIASDPFRHMYAVVEVDEIRQIVDPRPLNRNAGPVTLANGLQCRGRRPHL